MADMGDIMDGVGDVVGGAVKRLEGLFEKEQKTYGGSSIADGVLAGTGGRGFRFPSEDEAQAMIKTFKDRAESIERRQKLIEKAIEALANEFSADDVSVGYAKRAMDSLVALGKLNESAFNYANGYVERIDAVKRDKQHGEQEASDVFNRARR